jgi:hypothetical protein
MFNKVHLRKSVRKSAYDIDSGESEKKVLIQFSARTLHESRSLPEIQSALEKYRPSSVNISSVSSQKIPDVSIYFLSITPTLLHCFSGGMGRPVSVSSTCSSSVNSCSTLLTFGGCYLFGEQDIYSFLGGTMS